jgi:ribose/xylose/arabinose/galactoside ABC-type transport system permease subunit
VKRSVRRDSKTGLVKLFFTSRSSSVFLVFIGLVLLFSFFSPHHRFISQANIKTLLALGSEFSIIALGVGLLMISGEFDLSVGSILVFCSFIFIKLFETGMNLFLAGCITLGVGTLLGFLNGLITTKARIPSFITTLGTMMLWRGMTLILSQGFQRPFDPAVSPLLGSMLTGRIGGILPAQVVWFVVFGLILGVGLHFHKFGNWVYATGDNKEAARAMGIHTDRVKTICFMTVGILCAFVAVMQIVRVSTFSSRVGDGWELKAIAASVVGGTSLMGGIGSMVGVFLGALTISVIENGLVILRIPYFWTYIVFGLVIIFSVLSSRYLERRKLTHG